MLKIVQLDKGNDFIKCLALILRLVVTITFRIKVSIVMSFKVFWPICHISINVLFSKLYSIDNVQILFLIKTLTCINGTEKSISFSLIEFIDMCTVAISIFPISKSLNIPVHSPVFSL